LSQEASGRNNSIIPSQGQSYPMTDGQSAGLYWLPGYHLGPTTNFSFTFMEIIFLHLGICYYKTVSLTRGRVCNLQLLLGLTRAILLGSESRWTHDHNLLHHFLDSPKFGRRHCRIYFIEAQGGSDIPPGTGFPFRRLIRFSRMWGYSNPPPHCTTACIGLIFFH
jgi:hypothetical protein